MRKFRNALLALAIVSGSVFAGIEVLRGIEVLAQIPVQNGIEVLSDSIGYPAGAHVEARILVDDEWTTVDMAELDPLIGLSTVLYPELLPNRARIELHDGIEVLASRTYIGFGIWREN